MTHEADSVMREHASGIRMLVISSCTGRKSVSHDRVLTMEDFRDPGRLHAGIGCFGPRLSDVLPVVVEPPRTNVRSELRGREGCPHSGNSKNRHLSYHPENRHCSRQARALEEYRPASSFDEGHKGSQNPATRQTGQILAKRAPLGRRISANVSGSASIW